MSGIFGISNSIAKNVGINKFLTYNPRITGPRGYLVPTDETNIKDIDLGNQITAVEALTPFTVNHDDPQRISMMATQSKHMMPVKESQHALIGTGAEKTIVNLMNRDFAYQARQDGKVIEYDKENQIMIIQYKDGTCDAIDFTPQISFNGGGGFWISNEHETNLKEGSTFKKGDILSVNNSYFDPTTKEYYTGPLMKVMVSSGYYEYDDSSAIREGFGEAMTSYVTKQTRVILGPKTNVDFIVKVNDKVSVGDTLIKFEQMFDGDENANSILEKIGDEYKETISELSKNVYTSHYTGTIKKIEIYYNVDFEEISPSLQKIINQNYAPIKKKKKLVEKYTKSRSNIIFPPTEKIKDSNGKIKGVTVNGILIDIFLEYEDIMCVGDKFAFNSALKTVISMTYPDELAPYTESEPNEPIDAILSTYSVLNRLTGDLPINLYAHKTILGLKKKIKKIWLS